VFRLSPVVSPVLVCADDLDGLAWRVDEDRDWWPEIVELAAGIAGEMSRYAIGGDRSPHPLTRDDEPPAP
jgi:hypothetical protein